MMDRKADCQRRLAKHPRPEGLAGDLTRPHLGRFLECKDIEAPSDIPKGPKWWQPPKHGMEVKRGKAKQSRSR